MTLDRFRVKPPFIMQNGCVKDVCVCLTDMPEGMQGLVNPKETVLGFDGRMYIPTSYANTLGYYPISGEYSGSGMPDSGGSGASGSGSSNEPENIEELNQPEIGPVFERPKNKSRFRK